MDKVRTLESNLSTLAEKYYNLEKRRNLEVSGYKNEIKILNKRLDNNEERKV